MHGSEWDIARIPQFLAQFDNRPLVAFARRIVAEPEHVARFLPAEPHDRDRDNKGGVAPNERGEPLDQCIGI
ncbi:hypothetical protein STA1M1_37540 [Sinisalibacter aestuarii]|uniref:Uncharacterized protein n=1 Tax=Sinisalibacter aestuarii TaxID=2949426 RepID=A0ABQ5LY34_9RHOB|nr:hypothetical protein STA1M1_37540 [Sinisalibacter aestuarii]